MTKSELEVLKCLRGEGTLPFNKSSCSFSLYKRHDEAIENLKNAGVIYKDSWNILQIASRQNKEQRKI